MSAVAAALREVDSPEAELVRRIEEIDARLLTRAPTALDGALLLVERKSAYEALHPESTHGGDRRSQRFRDFKSQSISFCSDAARRLGQSERAIQLAVAMGEALADWADALRTTPIADNAAGLRAFAALEAAHRRTVLAIWSEQPRLSFQGVLQAARLRAAEDSDEVQFLRLCGDWQRAGSKARRRFLGEIGVPDRQIDSVIAAWRKRGAS